jgi:hypothetical protein
MPDARSYLGRGWGFPVRLDGKEGTIVLAEYEQDIKESIWIILSTAKGERVMRPDFGCGIHDLVFEAMSAAVLADIEDQVRTTLAAFEPRIDVVQVSAQTPDAGFDGKVRISIDYVVRGTHNQLNLVYPFYLRERG